MVDSSCGVCWFGFILNMNFGGRFIRLVVLSFFTVSFIVVEKVFITIVGREFWGGSIG